MSEREGEIDHATRDEFIRALARVATDGRRHLYGLSKADADDALAKAMEWCWTHREEFHTGLGTIGAWFATALKWCALGVRRDVARERERRSGLTPEEAYAVHLPSFAPRSQSDRAREGLSRIDQGIEQLLKRPKAARADCPKCWRCSYFEGLAPRDPPTSAWVDPELRAAVESIEREKIRIAKEVRERASGPRRVKTVKHAPSSQIRPLKDRRRGISEVKGHESITPRGPAPSVPDRLPMPDVSQNFLQRPGNDSINVTKIPDPKDFPCHL